MTATFHVGDAIEVTRDFCVKHYGTGRSYVLACDMALALSADPPHEGCQFVKATITFTLPGDHRKADHL